MEANIHNMIGEYSSVYEVGCGSGVNLYLFNKLKNINRLGGCDYSASLLGIANDVVNSSDLMVMDAEEIDTDNKYDVILSDSVFQYFLTPEKGLDVLDKMIKKANKMVVITEIHDKDFEDAHLNYRRSLMEDYDEKYKGLEKTFYDKASICSFLEEKELHYEIIKPKNDMYWNNDFVFDLYVKVN